MLRALVTDFRSAGHAVMVLLDARVAQFNPPLDADQIFKIEPYMDVSATIRQAAKWADAVYAIAPEAKRSLQSIAEVIEKSDTTSLNSPVQAIEEAADKAALEARAKSLGLKYPQTKIFGERDTTEGIANSINGKLGGFPVVVKPLFSAGCEGLSIVQNPHHLSKAIFKIKKENVEGQFAIQQLISGVPASVTLMCIDKEALPISLNLQQVTLESAEGTSSYDGGVVPLDHRLKTEALAAAKRLVESFSNLKGYVGVDLVLSNDGVFVMEVNPRLTTSYVGLRKVSVFNIAEALAQTIFDGELPKNEKTSGFCCFGKVRVGFLSNPEWQQVCNLEAVAAPPFPLDKTADSCAIVQSWGKTFLEASSGLVEAKKRIQKMHQRGEVA
jgi:predicted ATP-grasp superfamily ATP-dependent carboligase